MKVLYKNLPNYNVSKLVINSLDCSLYQAVVVIDGIEHVVWENDKKSFLSRSLLKLRESFDHLQIGETVLRHESSYDEMIGQPRKLQSNRMELDLGVMPKSIGS